MVTWQGHSSILHQRTHADRSSPCLKCIRRPELDELDDADLAEAEEQAGLPPGFLKRELRRDRDLGFDRANKRALYTCSGMAVENAEAAHPEEAAAAAAEHAGHSHSHENENGKGNGNAFGLGSSNRRMLRGPTAPAGLPESVDPSLAFQLHSRPGAPRTLLLDFTGGQARGRAGERDGGQSEGPAR